MRFYLNYPLSSTADGGAWLDPANAMEFARVAEESGGDGIGFTDHPAPSRKWLTGGGHETIDPFVGLGFMAAATSRMRVMTWSTILPYRNPLLMARSMTAVDVLSGGRATFVLGSGYLRSEFAALGVDFDERNELFDEAVEVIRALWTTDEVHYEGRHFNALGVALMPRPVQDPYPPLWVGGNSRIARERVAQWGQGWAPMPGGSTFTRTTRTPPIETNEDLADMIAAMRDRAEELGRDSSSIDVAASGATPLPTDATAEQRLDEVGQLAEIGVTWTNVGFPRDSYKGALDWVRQYGEEVIDNVG